MTDQKICVRKGCNTPVPPHKCGSNAVRAHCSFVCYHIDYRQKNRSEINRRARLRTSQTSKLKGRRGEKIAKLSELAHFFTRPRCNQRKFQKMPPVKIVRHWPYIVSNWQRLGV